jgi:eukaryotic-like serine/threonine-protein kinase
MAVHAGQLLPDRYRNPRLIGRGGMGEIYRATDAELGREVAVKMLALHQAEDEDIRGRFLREGLAAARLSGEPHIVTIYDVGEWQGRPFIVMECLAGGTLADRLAAGRPAPAQALAWLEQAASALDAAHAHGVVHRDVKPGNLLLDGAGDVHVADFGIASAAGLDSSTKTGTVLGTAGYLSPEQAAGGRATAASDRYALAVVAHELLTGSRPGAENGAPLVAAAGEVFDHALARDPAARYASAAAFVAALRVALVGGEPPTVVMRRRRRRPALAVAAALVVAGVLAALLLASIGTGGSGGQPPPQVVRTVTVPAAAPPQTSPTVPAAQVGKHGKPSHDHGKHGKEKGD